MRTTGWLTTEQSPPMPEIALRQHLLADRHQFAVPRHAHWDPLGLMGVRESLRERLSALGELEEHHDRAGEAGVNLILKLPGQQANA